MAALFAVLVCTIPSVANTQELQEATRQTDALAQQLTSKLSESDRNGILVLDLDTPDGQWLPFAAWLADQLSASLVNSGQGIRIVDRAGVSAALNAQGFSPKDEFELQKAVSLSRAVGAKTLIVGSYGAAENGVGVTLVSYRVSEYGVPHSKAFVIGVIRGKIDLTPDLSAHLWVPLNSLRPRDGIAFAGTAGVTIPECIKCAPPSRMSAPDIDLVGFLRDKRGAGTIQLKFVVTLEGHTTEIAVSHPIGYGLDEQYVMAAKDFEFKPAVDADNKPVPVRTNLVFEINMK